MAMEAYENKTEREVIFDTDSKPVGIDNCASAYISGDIDDFDGKLEETNRVIKGFGGTSKYKECIPRHSSAQDQR
jgi:hypothetical protein